MAMMRRILRIASIVIAALSFVLCVLISWLWYRCPSGTHHTLHYISAFDSRGDSWAIDASMLDGLDRKIIILGTMSFHSSQPPSNPESGWSGEFKERTRIWSWVFGYFSLRPNPAASYLSESGFAYVVTEPTDLRNGMNEQCRFVMMPIWFAIVVTAIPPVVCVIVFLPPAVRRRLRKKRGRCLQCGYDLRGTAPERACPECGAVRSVAAASDEPRP